MEKVRSRKAPVFGKVDKVVAPKGYLANSEGGPASETLQSVRSDMLTNGQVVWVKSQQALYVYSQTGTAPTFPLGVASSPTGCWRRVAPELYQFGSGAPTVDAAYVGQGYLDTTNDVWYKSVAIGTGANDWVSGEGGSVSPYVTGSVDTPGSVETLVLTRPLASSRTHIIEVSAFARRVSDGEIGSFKYSTVARVDGGGSVSLSPPVEFYSGSFGVVRLDGLLNGALRVYVTGVVATPIEWLVSSISLGDRA